MQTHLYFVYALGRDEAKAEAAQGQALGPVPCAQIRMLMPALGEDDLIEQLDDIADVDQTIVVEVK